MYLVRNLSGLNTAVMTCSGSAMGLTWGDMCDVFIAFNSCLSAKMADITCPTAHPARWGERAALAGVAGRGPGQARRPVLPGVTDGCRERCRRHPGPGLSPLRLWPCPRPPHRRLRFAQLACRGTRRDCRPRMRRRWRDLMELPR